MIYLQVRTLFVSGLPMDAKPRELYLLFRAYKVNKLIFCMLIVYSCCVFRCFLVEKKVKRFIHIYLPLQTQFVSCNINKYAIT